MSLTVFDFLKSLTQKNYFDFDRLDEPDRKSYNIFMINRYISMDSRFLLPINQIDKYSFNVFSKKMHYVFLYNILPKGFVFFNYIKKEKEENESSTNKNNIELLSNHLNISKNQAKVYLQFLTEEDIKNLKISYGLNRKKEENI